jgi:hypothetical protein
VDKENWSNLPWRPIAAVVGLLILFALTVAVTANEHASELSKGLLQFIFFVAAAGLAVDLGRQSLKRGTTDVLKPHGRKAVRRIVRLGQGIGSFSTTIATQRDLMRQRGAEQGGAVEVFEVEGAFEMLEAHVAAQLGIVEDAIEDWRDVVPAEVEAIESRAREVNENGD